MSKRKKKEKGSTVEKKVRVLTWAVVLISYALGRFVHPVWLWPAGIVGLNLIQGAFTGFCPVERFVQSVSRS